MIGKKRMRLREKKNGRINDNNEKVIQEEIKEEKEEGRKKIKGRKKKGKC